MQGTERREQIIHEIRESTAPVSGKKLAALYNVSRQVIVQDIALIRRQVMIFFLQTENIFCRHRQQSAVCLK